MLSRVFYLGIAACIIHAAAAASFAQMYKGKPISHVSILCGNILPGKGFTLGIRLKLEPQWHAYWKNPGDAGLPMTAQLIDANGYAAGDLRFPTPHKYAASDVVMYGYDSEVVFLLPVKAPAGVHTSPQFKIKLTWLSCKDVCLPGEAVLNFTADSVSAADRKENQKLLDRWTAKLPQPGNGFNLDKTGTTVTEKDEKLSVFIKFLEVTPGTITDFYPEVIDGFVTDYSDIKISDAGITLTLTPETKDSKLTAIKGLAMIGTSGYEVNFTEEKN
jgi:thiol:disulfide interchange protein DsbD